MALETTRRGTTLGSLKLGQIILGLKQTLPPLDNTIQCGGVSTVGHQLGAHLRRGIFTLCFEHIFPECRPALGNQNDIERPRLIRLDHIEWQRLTTERKLAGGRK